MSRIGKLPVEIPEGVELSIDGQTVTAKGKLGTLSTTLPSEVTIEKQDKEVIVKPANDDRRARSMWGLSRSLMSNLVEGVSKGYEKRLEILGVGYRAAMSGNMLNIALGYSHDIRYAVPEGITIKCEKPTLLSISGIDKQKVGQVASEIRAMRKPEPYKGKGVRYEGEFILMKEGKKK